MSNQRGFFYAFSIPRNYRTYGYYELSGLGFPETAKVIDMVIYCIDINDDLRCLHQALTGDNMAASDIRVNMSDLLGSAIMLTPANDNLPEQMSRLL